MIPSNPSPSPLSTIYGDLCRGRISRREFILRAAGLGAAAPLALMLVNSVDESSVSAQTPERPTLGTSDQTRGAGGELKVRQWYAPGNVVAHLTDFPQSAAQISSMILEPLLSYAPDGSLLPTLAKEVPSKENGGLSADLSVVTLNLRDDVVWSDGEPFTADDVVWTWQWINDASNKAVSAWLWSEIHSIEATNATQVQLIYAKPTPAWFFPIAGAFSGGIIPRHVWSNADTDTVNAAFATNPIGTGPYRIETFVPNDHIVCTINERYREPTKPYFDTVLFQAGGDSATDVQAVLQDGGWDVAADITVNNFAFLRELEASGGKGRMATTPPTEVEHIEFNFSDPRREIDGERSSLQAPHPFLTDRAVRQAMAMAIDRQVIVSDVFGGGDNARATSNMLNGLASMESTNTSFEFDIAGANDVLDRAGWERVGDTRVKDGIQLAVSYYTTGIGDLEALVRFRPKIQEVVKTGWEAIGIEVELGLVSAEDFFTVTPENERSLAHFYRDIEMFANGPGFPLPETFFASWYAGPDNSNVAQKANDWSGGNIQRYIDPEFDRLYEEATTTTDTQRAAELYIQMNDRIVGDFVAIPLAARPFSRFALSNRIADDNIAPNGWEPLFWNIANWRTVESQPGTPAP